ncbi:nitrite reductase small subunit NirD [Sediminitomix flava]|uniref:Nitrite reductase (NADH) small subunit n=1 Tax=Sediminitomix flava TaxID=379075 RepID=A0A315ZBB7_SEDFL|nr:nitrite reductase small subunit NirD [Sediminitomix flava]PWJ42876.1 nitrite reductase (NADH) small subunit [Sediminitomix flava]
MIDTIYKTVASTEVTKWELVGHVNDFSKEGGECVKVGDLQIAVFNFTSRGEWYACQNVCPHKMQAILSRGMIGSHGDEPKVACPFHKKTFSLKTGENLNGNESAIATYPVKIENENVYIGLS